MTTKISPREWEALSAYLDGALSSQERNRLEERLEENPEMHSALQDLRRDCSRSAMPLQAVSRIRPSLSSGNLTTRPPSSPAPIATVGGLGSAQLLITSVSLKVIQRQAPSARDVGTGSRKTSLPCAISDAAESAVLCRAAIRNLVPALPVA